MHDINSKSNIFIWEPLLSDLSHLKGMKKLQVISDKIQLLIQQRNAKVDKSKSEIIVYVEGIPSVIEKPKVVIHDDELHVEEKREIKVQ